MDIEKQDYLGTEGLSVLVQEFGKGTKAAIEERIVKAIDDLSDDSHIPSAKAVNDTLNKKVSSTVNQNIYAMMSNELGDIDDNGHIPSSFAVVTYVDDKVGNISKSIDGKVADAMSGVIVTTLDDGDDEHTPSAKAVSTAIAAAIESKVSELLSELDAEDVDGAIQKVLDKAVDAVSTEVDNIIVNTIDGESDDEHVPSAKAVHDILTNKLGGAIEEAVSDILAADVNSDDDTHAPSAKAVNSYVEGRVKELIRADITGDDDTAPSSKAVRTSIDEVRDAIPETLSTDTIKSIFKEEFSKAAGVGSGSSSDTDIPEINADDKPDAEI